MMEKFHDRPIFMTEIPIIAKNVFYLILIPSKTAALHSTRVVVASMIKLIHRQRGWHIVEHGGQATAQGDELGSGLVEAYTHAALLG